MKNLIFTLFCFLILFGTWNVFVIFFKHQWIIRRLKKKQPDLVAPPTFSIDELIYFITFPTTIDFLQNIKQKQIKLVYDFESYSTLHPKGIKVYLQTQENSDYPLAYLHFTRLLIPKYMLMYSQQRITKQELQTLQTHLFFSKRMRSYVQEEVYKKLNKKSEQR